MRNINKYWLFVSILGMLLTGFFAGSTASVLDARRHGLPVPHLWERYQEFKCTTK